MISMSVAQIVAERAEVEADEAEEAGNVSDMREAAAFAATWYNHAARHDAERADGLFRASARCALRARDAGSA